MHCLDFALVGPGRLGLRIARALSDTGARCRAVRAHRRPATHASNMVPGCRIFDTPSEPRRWPGVQLILVAVPDREIAAAARDLARQALTPGTVVLHTSGFHTSELLAPCRAAGALTGSWHPLQSFPAGDRPIPLRGVWCAVEGHPTAVDTAYRLSRDLEMRPWKIAPEAKPRYHAAAALAANVTHVLVAASASILGDTGIPSGAAGGALEPLVITSLRAALNSEGLAALTGPMARGDVETLARHLEVLPPELAEIYRRAARVAASWSSMTSRASIDRREGDV